MKVPSKRTLAKYGMQAYHFAFLHGIQGGLCGVCDKRLDDGMVYIEHEHVKGYAKLKPQDKRRYVRGLACFGCNRFLIGKNTRETIDAVATYLRKPYPLVTQ